MIKICSSRSYIYKDNINKHAGWYVTHGPGYEEIIDENSCYCIGDYIDGHKVYVNGIPYNMMMWYDNLCILDSQSKDRLCRDIGRLDLVGHYHGESNIRPDDL